MAKTILTNVRLFAGGVDLTGQSNQVEISAEFEDKDATHYASAGWKEVLPGLASTEITASGQWEAGDPGKIDDASWSSLGTTAAWTVCPVGASVGQLAYSTRALRTSYGLLDAVGEVAPWSGTAVGSWPLVRGTVAHPPGVAETGADSTTGQQLGAVPVGKRLYASLHVLSVAGSGTPTLTVDIESDTDNTFSSPVTQLSFTPATGIGSQILRTDGSAITDTWYRVSFDVTGTTPSFMFVVAFGIQ